MPDSTRFLSVISQECLPSCDDAFVLVVPPRRQDAAGKIAHGLGLGIGNAASVEHAFGDLVSRHWPLRLPQHVQGTLIECPSRERQFFGGGASEASPEHLSNCVPTPRRAAAGGFETSAKGARPKDWRCTRPCVGLPEIWTALCSAICGQKSRHFSNRLAK
jgi:hypothetical protein